MALIIEGGVFAELGTLGALATRDEELCDSLPLSGRTAAQEAEWQSGLCDLADDLFGLFDPGEAGAFADVFEHDDSMMGVGTGGFGGIGIGGGSAGGLDAVARGDAIAVRQRVTLSLTSIEASMGFDEPAEELADRAFETLSNCWYDADVLTGSFQVSFEIDEWGSATSVVVTGIDDDLVSLCVEYDFLSLWHDNQTGFTVSLETTYTALDAETP